MTETLIEPFTGYDKCGKAYLRGWKSRKVMTVAWGDGTLWDSHEFATALDSTAMDATLKEIWERYKPGCGRRAEFSRGPVHGCMFRVPIAAGEETMAVVRDYFTRALAKLPDR